MIANFSLKRPLALTLLVTAVGVAIGALVYTTLGVQSAKVNMASSLVFSVLLVFLGLNRSFGRAMRVGFIVTGLSVLVVTVTGAIQSPMASAISTGAVVVAGVGCILGVFSYATSRKGSRV